MEREEIKKLQWERLQVTLNRAFLRVGHYRKMFEERGIEPQDIRSLEDLSILPFTTREDLTGGDPYQMFAVPLRDIVRLHVTKGRRGEPIVVGFTSHDLDIWTELSQYTLCMAGIGREDVIQITFPFSMSSAALGFQYGAEKLGAAVIPYWDTEVSRGIEVMEEYRATCLITLPSYFSQVFEKAKKGEVKLSSLSLKKVLLYGEPFYTSERDEWEELLEVKIIDTYGLTEIFPPGIACECLAREGMHVFEEHLLIEIVDPTTGKVLPSGETGELVITTLTKEGVPLIRYRTGDITSIITEKCSCGSDLVRIERIKGRTDNTIVVEGIRISAEEVEDFLSNFKKLSLRYQLIVERKEGKDSLSVKVELPPGADITSFRAIEKTSSEAEEKFMERTGIPVKFHLLEPGGLGEKYPLIIDKRKRS